MDMWGFVFVSEVSVVFEVCLGGWVKFCKVVVM